jgi:hypothetical protein
MKFEFEIDESDYEEASTDAYSLMLKFGSYLKCIKTREGWLESQDVSLVKKYLMWFCRPDSTEDDEIRNYELAYMAASIYYHMVIEPTQIADLFIRRYSRFKGYVDSGSTCEEACKRDFEDAKKFNPPSDLLRLQGRVFFDINNEMMAVAYSYIDTYAHLYYDEPNVFKTAIPTLFSIFDEDWRNLFTDETKMIVFEINTNDITNHISYVPDVDEEEEEGQSVYVLSAPNLIAATLEWYGDNVPIAVTRILMDEEDDDDDEEDD